MPRTVKVNGAIEYRGDIPSTVRTKAKWERFLTRESGFTCVIANKVKVHVFLNESVLTKFPRQRASDGKSFLFARIIGQLPKIDWRVEAEPTSNEILGLIAYNDKGKALLAPRDFYPL